MIRRAPPAALGAPPMPAEEIGRRSVVEWLGKAAVLAIGADLAAACSAVLAERDGGADGGADAGPDAGAGCGPDDFPFAPGPEAHPVYEGWGERTVDPQGMLEILAGWRLRIDGMVGSPVELAFHQLLALPRHDQVSDFHCVEGWTIRDVPWNGVHFSQLLELAGPLAEATHVTIHTRGDVYGESLPLDVALEPATLLAYGVGCSTLPLKHGFPLRVVVPRKWAYKSAKYVYRLELTDHPVDGFWEKHGYPYDADVPGSWLDR